MENSGAKRYNFCNIISDGVFMFPSGLIYARLHYWCLNMRPHLTPMNNRIPSTYTVSIHVVTEHPAQTRNIAATNSSNLCDTHYIYVFCFFLARQHPPPSQWAMASLFTRFLYHTQRRTTFGKTPLDEWSARRRDFYLTTHNKHLYSVWDSNPHSQQASSRRPTP